MNPVPKRTIAHTSGGGLQDTCTRIKENHYCNGIKDVIAHDALDILNSYEGQSSVIFLD